MEGKLFLDTKLLRQHITQIERERRCAQMLYDYIEAAKNLSGEATREDYRRLLEDARCLTDYFRAMANVIDNISTNAEQTIVKLGQLLQDMANSNPTNTIFHNL